MTVVENQILNNNMVAKSIESPSLIVFTVCFYVQ